MIQLPDNWQDYLQISPKRNTLFLHLYNSAGQFFTYYFPVDPAFPLTRTLEVLTQRLNEDALTAQAYIIESDMSTVRTEPADQNWGPASLPGDDMMSLKQYQVMQQTKSSDAPAAPPIPGPEGLPSIE